MADFLHNIQSALKGAFAKSEGSVLGVDVSSSTIKVVQLRKKGGRAVLETYGELALGPYAGVAEGSATQLSTEQMTAAIKDLMTEAKVSAKHGGVAIPLSASLINVLSMPDVGEKRLADMIPLEMRKYVPVNISEVLLDWRVIPKTEREQEKEDQPQQAAKTDVLIVAIHRETLTRYQKIISDAGLDVSFFEIEVFSTLRAVIDGTASPVMVLDLGAGTTKIYIVEHRVLRESHIINRGSQDMTLALSKSLGISREKASALKHAHGLLADAPDKSIRETLLLVLDSILSEAARVMRGYQRRHQRNVGSVVLTGGGAGLKGITEAAQRHLETDVSLADPFSKMVAPAFLEEVLKDAGPEFAVAIGAALRKLEEAE